MAPFCLRWCLSNFLVITRGFLPNPKKLEEITEGGRQKQARCSTEEKTKHTNGEIMQKSCKKCLRLRDAEHLFYLFFISEASKKTTKAWREAWNRPKSEMNSKRTGSWKTAVGWVWNPPGSKRAWSFGQTEESAGKRPNWMQELSWIHLCLSDRRITSWQIYVINLLYNYFVGWDECCLMWLLTSI